MKVYFHEYLNIYILEYFTHIVITVIVIKYICHILTSQTEES